MANDDNNDNSLDDVGMTNTDRAFLVFLFGVLILTGWLGYEAYLEGHRTETTKESGETWGKWLTTAGAERFNKDYAISACTPTDANSNAPHVWGDCLKAITTKPAELSNLINPFTHEPITIGTLSDVSLSLSLILRLQCGRHLVPFGCGVGFCGCHAVAV
jgi:hypothetical protein